MKNLFALLSVIPLFFGLKTNSCAMPPKISDQKTNNQPESILEKQYSNIYDTKLPVGDVILPNQIKNKLCKIITDSNIECVVGNIKWILSFIQKGQIIKEGIKQYKVYKRDLIQKIENQEYYMSFNIVNPQIVSKIPKQKDRKESWEEDQIIGEVQARCFKKDKDINLLDFGDIEI
jgi:hypothetical protein